MEPNSSVVMATVGLLWRAWQCRRAEGVAVREIFLLLGADFSSRCEAVLINF